MKYAHIITLALASLALASCNASLPGGLTKADIFDQVPKQGKLADHIKLPEVPSLMSADAKAMTDFKAETQRRQLVAGSTGLAAPDSLSGYSQAVLDRIIAAGPAPDRRATVHILTNQSLGAIALPSGDIYLNHSLFGIVANEDQLAFLLAHEYSHVLLQHSAESALSKARPYLLASVDLAVAYSAHGDMTGGVGLRLYGSDFLAAGLIAPAWSRHQEEIADHLGVDLMTRAGYNPSESSRALRAFRQYEESYRIEEEFERNKLAQALTTAGGSSTSGGSTLPTFGPLSVLGTLGTSLTQELSTQLGDLMHQMGQGHEDAAARMKALHTYVRREYKAEERKPIQSSQLLAALKQAAPVLENYDRAFRVGTTVRTQAADVKTQSLIQEAQLAVSGPTANAVYTRFAFAQLRASQGAFKQAVENLERAQAPEGILPVQMEVLRASWLVNLQRNDEAITQLRKVGGYYDWPVSIYHSVIPLLRAKGGADAQSAVEMGQACIMAYPLSRELCS